LIYGSTELSTENTKLEAFVYQVHQFAEKRNKGVKSALDS
jgi:hypothetical protein